MPSFSREKSPRRDVIVPLRVSSDEAATIDALAERLGLETRAEVLRAGLDALNEKLSRSGGRRGGKG